LPEIGRKESAILRVLGQSNVPLGASAIARELVSYGIELTERAVRYHLQALDDAGLTRSRGRNGRCLTDAGLAELDNARVTDKVALAFARLEALAYQTTFTPATGRGKVVLNVSLFPRSDFDHALRVMRPVFLSRLATSDLVAIFEPGQKVGEQLIPRGMIGLGTVCSATINGVLVHAGIPVHSEFGGLIEIAGHEPARFTEVVLYRGTSVDPVEFFIKSRATSVSQAATTGRGKVGAGFRTCPSVAREHVLRLLDDLAPWRLQGVVAVGAPGQSLLEMEVGLGRVGFVVCAGLNPVAAAEEAGITTTSKALATVFEYTDLRPV
jgi:HTH-type transcriptional regulator, global nitrogen regulator NrpRI